MLIAGVDEAGRGPVLGPMVLCAYSLEPGQEGWLREIGVRDSKLLSPQVREKLAEKLRQTGNFVIKTVSAQELTVQMRLGVSLNELEAKQISGALIELNSKGKISKAFVDSPDSIASKFEKRIRKYFDHKFDLVCENKADFKYPVVGAASILAKVGRDQAVQEIKHELMEHGITDDFGSGYSHDPATISFLKKHHKEPALQPFIRHEWETAKRLKVRQVDLTKFI